MKNQSELKPLVERIRVAHQRHEEKKKEELRRAAERQQLAGKSFVAGKKWAIETADPEMLRAVERVLMREPWKAHHILSRHNIGDWDVAAFTKGAVAVYRDALVEADRQ